MKKFASLIMVLTLFSLVIVGCSSDDEADSAPAPAAKAAPAPAAKAAPAPASEALPGAGKTLTVLVTNVGNGRFNNWLSEGEDLKQHRPFNNSLVGGGGGSIITPSIASDWTMQADGMAWTFTINEDDIKWHDGTQLTAEDVFWSFEKKFGSLVPGLVDAGCYEPRNAADSKQFAGVEKDGNKITVRTTVPRPDLPFNQSQNAQGTGPEVMPKEYTLGLGDGDACAGFDAYEKAPIGNGAMKVTDFVQEQKYEYERFVDYYWTKENGFSEDRTYKFEKLVLEVVPEDSTRVAALAAGDADLIEGNVLMIPDIEAISGTQISWQDESAYNWVVMVDCWEVDMWCYDKRVRQAVEMAIDRKTIVDNLYGRGGTMKGWGHVTPNSMGYSEALDPPAYDLDKAIALLKEAGIEDGKWKGEQVKFSIYTWEAGDTPLLPELSQLFRDAWVENLGFDVDVVVGDAAGTRQAWNNRELPGHVLVRTNEARYDGTSIVTGSWTNPEIAWRAIKGPDAEPFKRTTVPAARKALADINPDTRAASFNEAYKVLKDENLWWSAFFTNLPWGVGPTVSSYEPWKLVPYVTALYTVEMK